MTIGWIILINWQMAAASTVYLCGALIQGLVVLSHPSYIAKPWHGMLIFWAILAFCVIFNTVIGSLLPRVESFGLVLHMVGFVAVIVPLVYLAPHRDAHFVFTTFENNGNWPTQGLSFMVGLSGNIFTLLGQCQSILHLTQQLILLAGLDGAVHVWYPSLHLFRETLTRASKADLFGRCRKRSTTLQ